MIMFVATKKIICIFRASQFHPHATLVQERRDLLAVRLDDALVTEAVQRLDRRRKAAEQEVTQEAARIGETALGETLLEMMERRWNGSFKSIGHYLSKKRSAAGDK